jgi:hypothetical protein
MLRQGHTANFSKAQRSSRKIYKQNKKNHKRMLLKLQVILKILATVAACIIKNECNNWSSGEPENALHEGSVLRRLTFLLAFRHAASCSGLPLLSYLLSRFAYFLFVHFALPMRPKNFDGQQQSALAWCCLVPPPDHR